MLFDYSKTEKLCWQEWLQKSYFINNLIDKKVDIFISYRKRIDYISALKLFYDGVITIPSNPFEQFDLIEIEFLLANVVLQSLQYDSNKYTGVYIFKSYLIHEVKKKTTNKLYKRSCFMMQGYNDIEKSVFLTQVFIIQQCRQCFLLLITPALCKQGIKMILCDII